MLWVGYLALVALCRYVVLFVKMLFRPVVATVRFIVMLVRYALFDICSQSMLTVRCACVLVGQVSLPEGHHTF